MFNSLSPHTSKRPHLDILTRLGVLATAIGTALLLPLLLPAALGGVVDNKLKSTPSTFGLPDIMEVASLSEFGTKDEAPITDKDDEESRGGGKFRGWDS